MVVSGGSEEQFRSALGHAAANTNLPLWYVQYGRPAHALKANYGQMALGGIDAAICARRNIIGPFAMLSDSERGFARIIGSDQFDPSQLSANLRQIWRTKESSLKAFPCCAFLHTTIDAILKIVSDNNIDQQHIEKLLIRCFARIGEWFSDDAPSSALDAQFSVQYVSAMALLSVEPGREWYSPSMMTSPRVSELMRKIDIEVDPIAERAFWRDGQHMSSVTVSIKGGQFFNTTVDWPRGHWRRPFHDSEVERKFLHNVSGTPLEAHGEEIIERTMNIDRSNSLNELHGLLRVAGK
ncbi:MAG: MmgE/PrpD family protein [Mesorhizobium sp.]|nr:MAG: MmgE/PrpD family protein [Mesorhizobium sp.]